MHPAIALSALSLLAPRTSADGVSDFRGLQTVAVSATAQIISAMNATQATNGTAGLATGTSDLLGNITSAIMDSKTRLDGDQIAFVNFVTSDILDGAYVEYINEIPTLASVVAAQGRTWPTTAGPDQPVLPSLQALAEAIQVYSNDLRQRGLISQTATIRTIRAGSALLQAQREWSRGPLSERRKRAVFR